jgi:hypothetical protein
MSPCTHTYKLCLMSTYIVISILAPQNRQSNTILALSFIALSCILCHLFLSRGIFYFCHSCLFLGIFLIIFLPFSLPRSCFIPHHFTVPFLITFLPYSYLFLARLFLYYSDSFRPAIPVLFLSRASIHIRFGALKNTGS